MSFRYDDIGNRVRAFRLGSGLTAEQVAQRIGISRTALYRVEKGEIAKIETLERLADLLGVSIATLLGVGVEYLSSGVTYFERVRQLEEASERIVVLAGPISFLLSSPEFQATLALMLKESVPEDAPDHARMLDDVDRIMEILAQRRETYKRRQPSVINLISALDIERLLVGGFAGNRAVPDEERRERRRLAHSEVARLAKLIEDEPMGIQIGVLRDILPYPGFQIFRQPDREVLTVSPFRLGERPNVHLGVAMATSAEEALKLHHNVVREMWRRALKGEAAARYLRSMVQNSADMDGIPRLNPKGAA